jgi:hypothetical protein
MRRSKAQVRVAARDAAAETALAVATMIPLAALLLLLAG